MLENYLQLGTVAVIFLFAIKEFFAWMKSRKNGNGYTELSARLKSISNDNHHEVIAKLDELIKINNEQLYILKDVKSAVEK